MLFRSRMGLIKKQWELIQDNKIKHLAEQFGEDYYQLRPLNFIGDEEHYISPKNIHFIYNVMTYTWVVEL